MYTNDMNWAFFAILASLFWGIVNLLDKTILSRYKLNPWDYLALDGFVGIIPLTIILLVSTPFASSPRDIFLALASGVALAFFSVLYFYALRLIDVAVIVILTQSLPIFSLIWGVSILGENYQIYNYVGMLILLLGIILASTSEKHKHEDLASRKLSRTVIASFLMLIATLVASFGFLAQKIALATSSIPSVFFWQRLSLVGFSIFILTIRYSKIKGTASSAIVATSLVEIVNLLGVLSITFAYSVGPLAGVGFLSSLQPVWVIVIIWILSLLKSRLIPIDPNISRFQLAISCLLVVVGMYLVSI